MLAQRAPTPRQPTSASCASCSGGSGVSPRLQSSPASISDRDPGCVQALRPDPGQQRGTDEESAADHGLEADPAPAPAAVRTRPATASDSTSSAVPMPCRRAAACRTRRPARPFQTECESGQHRRSPDSQSVGRRPSRRVSADANGVTRKDARPSQRTARPARWAPRHLWPQQQPGRQHEVAGQPEEGRAEDREQVMTMPRGGVRRPYFMPAVVGAALCRVMRGLCCRYGRDLP